MVDYDRYFIEPFSFLQLSHLKKIINLEHTFNFGTIITHVKRETELELKYIMVDLKTINLVLR